jgi:hypothetical protein
MATNPGTVAKAVAKGSAEAIRLVVFGLPGSGKSALLGALALAAHKQQPQLSGQFTSVPDDLKQLARRVYSDNVRQQPTAPTTPAGGKPSQEVLGYSVGFQASGAKEQSRALLIDGSGLAAGDLLQRKSVLEGKSSAGSLARSVQEAHGLILLLDASLSPEHFERQFAAFGQFLRRLEEGRGRRTEISGLPVYLVLTKCDLLAEPKDSVMDWMEQIEQRKREVGDAFRDFLAREGAASGNIPFGRIDLHVWATAIGRPALNKAPAKPHEPFGVAELFRQSLEKADAYRESRLRAGRRLFWTAGSAAGLLLLMGSLTAGLAFYNQDKIRSPLETEIEGYRVKESSSAAERLRNSEKDLRDNLLTLNAMIARTEEFKALSDFDKNYLESRVKEIDDYLQYLARVLETPSPSTLTSMAKLQEIRERLEKELTPAEDWKETAAGGLYRDLLEKFACLDATVRELDGWLRDNRRTALKLWTFEDEELRSASWNARTRTLLANTSTIKFQDAPFLPCSKELTPDNALTFDKVALDLNTFRSERARLVQVRNLLGALGLLGQEMEWPGVLVINPPFALDSAPKRVESLQKAYPDFATDMLLEKAPEKYRKVVVREAGAYYNALLEPARKEVAEKFQQQGMSGLREWLKNPKELASWRVLAQALNRLREHPEANSPMDPVADLAEFLQTKQFRFYPKSLTLVIPEDWRKNLPGNTKLTITYTSLPGGQTQKLVYRWDENEPTAEGDNLLYTYDLSSGTEIVYQPGDAMEASLSVAKGKMLRWISQPSALYQFGRLLQPPRLYADDQPTSRSEREEGISIRPPEKVDSGLRVPDLLPRSVTE